MASSLHLDPADLKKVAATYFGVTVTQKDGDFIVSWPANKISASLRSLRLAGAFTIGNLTVEVQSIDIAEAGIDVKFSAN
ncbi:MAG TPA: hypothetical protein VGP72_01860 [Planctomycetota bacterium]|jgi:hypothetical protein